MSNISSTQLEKILEANTKSIEIYLEVNSQYEEIIENLKEIKTHNQLHITTNEPAVARMKEILDKLETKISDDHTKLKEKNDEIITQLAEIEKTMSRQNLILFGSGASIILGIIGKLLGINIGL